MSTNTEKLARYLSIDALRGLTVAAMLLVNNAGDWEHVYPWLEHAVWDGTTPADFIFPFFLVIVGVSMQLAFAPKLDQGQLPSELMPKIVWRSVKIVGLGILLHLIAMWFIPGREFRLFGVLQRIGICFLFAGFIMLYVRSWRTQVGMIVSILLAYWAMLSSSGSYEPHLNLV